MLALTSLTFLSINGSNTLFQAKERLIDLSTFDLPILGVVLAVRGSFTAGQVDKEELSALFHSFLLDFDLTHSVTST